MANPRNGATLELGDDDNLGDPESRLWTHGGSKFVLGTVDGPPLTITAQYNPKDLSYATSASWEADPHPFKADPKRNCRAFFQYKTTDSRSLTVELVFDSYEERFDPNNPDSFVSIEPLVAKLERLVVPIDQSSRRQSERRPQLCVAVWGTAKPFRCIVQSVSTKVTMVARNGAHQRAVCTVTLKEADIVTMLERDGVGGGDAAMDKLDERIRKRSQLDRVKRAQR